MATRKILYSPRFGAGWTSWHHGFKEEKRFMLEYAPFIAALERGEEISDALEERFCKEFAAKFPTSKLPYMGGVAGLAIHEAPGLVRIDEYDGSESVIDEGSELDSWL